MFCDDCMIWFRGASCWVLCFELVSFVYLFKCLTFSACRRVVVVSVVNSVVFFFSFMWFDVLL